MARDSGNHGNGFMADDDIGVDDAAGQEGCFLSAYKALLGNDEIAFLVSIRNLGSAELTTPTPEGGTLLHLISKSSLSDVAFFALLNKQPEGFRCEHMGIDQAATAFLNKKINWQHAIKLKEKMPHLTFQI